MTRLRLSVAFVVVVLLGGCSPAETPETATTADAELESLRQRAEQGDANSQYDLGYMYSNGEGVPRDDVEAVKWYRLAADQGDAQAQFNLSRRYNFGLGVPQDDTQTAAWLRQATDQGHAGAQTQLGLMYLDGRGVPQDFVEAHKWYNLAAARANGDDREQRERLRDNLAEQMTPAQLAEAQKLAREWQAGFEKRQAE